MADSPKPRPGDDEPRIADVNLLFGDSPSRSDSGATAAGPPPGDSYDVEEADEPSPRPSVAPIPPAPSQRKARPAPERPARPTLEPSEAVEQVWSRGAEWGPSLVVLAASAFVLVLLLYATVSHEQYGLAFFLLVVGGLALLFLSYPIFITLERPVRMTPEQAVGDYYTALSHHVPHFRRMWLLLSSAGRTSGSFGSFEGFQAYWKERLATLKAGRAGTYTPLKFQVVDFKSEKSAGQAVIDVKYTVQVYVRGRLDEGPIETVRFDTSLVRGPDRMWYLDLGTLPAPAPGKSSH